MTDQRKTLVVVVVPILLAANLALDALDNRNQKELNRLADEMAMMTIEHEDGLRFAQLTIQSNWRIVRDLHGDVEELKSLHEER